MHKLWMLLLLGLGAHLPVLAETPAQLRDGYAKAAGLAPSAVVAAEGEALFRHGGSGEKQCASCHTGDPRQAGKTRVGKRIAPMAPVANPERFTDAKKTEKWFGRNCKDVLERECTPREKASFIAWLMTIQ